LLSASSKLARFIPGMMSRAGLDAAVSFSIVNRLWTACSGLILLVLVGLFTNPSTQGFYYTFNSLIYMQVFIEMGLGIALVQLIGHEMALLSHGEHGRIVGNDGAKKRLHSLVRFAGAWFACGSVVLFALLCVLGILFFSYFGKHQVAPGEFSAVITAWVLVAFGVSSSLVVNAALFIVEGSGRIATAARIRLLQGVISTSAAAITLACGGGLFAIACQTVLMPVVGAIAILYGHRSMLVDLWSYRSDLPGLDWRRDIWPFQSRIAISWLSGFFTLQIFSPLLFAQVGAKAAGSMGMSLQIFTALNGLFIVLLTARTPVFTRLVALGRRDELRRRFKEAFLQSVVLLLIAIMMLPLALLIGYRLLPQLSGRLLPWQYLIPLGLACMANHIVSAEAVLLRAHREEPFMVLSAVGGILTLGGAAGLIAFFGLPGAVFAYSGVALLFTLPVGTRIFLRYWKANA
jgi:O-antigen/teichoic acid export membrane protein